MNKYQPVRAQITPETLAASRANQFRINRKGSNLPNETLPKKPSSEIISSNKAQIQMEAPITFTRNSNSKPSTLSKMESMGSLHSMSSLHDTETTTVSKIAYDNQVKEHKVQLQRAELEIKIKDDRIKNLEQQLRELRQLAAKLDEKNNLLAQENLELKRKEQEIKIKKPSAQVRSPTENEGTNGSLRKTTTHLRRSRPNLEEEFEEEKEMEKPPEMSLEEWQSLQLAIQLQREETRAHMRNKARMMLALNEFHLMRALQESQTQGGFDPNRSLSSINPNQINPDNMTYEQLLQLGDKIGHVNKGLTLKQIKKIPKTKYKKVIGKSQEEKQCSICFCEYEDGENLRKLVCKHDFHSRCIKQWLVTNKACPVCKKEAV